MFEQSIPVQEVEMNLEIRGLQGEITDSIREYIERRLAFSLDRFAEKIRMVRLKVRDVNSSRGGIDKYCRLAISFKHSSSIAVESCDSSITGAVDRASDKMRRLIARHFGRRRKSRRSGKLPERERLVSLSAETSPLGEMSRESEAKRLPLAVCHEEILAA